MKNTLDKKNLDLKEFYTCSQCAKLLNTTTATLLKWGHAGHLPYIKMERKTLWHWPSVKTVLLKIQKNFKETA